MSEFSIKLKELTDIISFIEKNKELMNVQDLKKVHAIVHNILPKIGIVEQQCDLLEKTENELEKDLEVTIQILKSLIKL